MEYSPGTKLIPKYWSSLAWYWLVLPDGKVNCYDLNDKYMHHIDTPLFLVESDWDIRISKESEFDELYLRLK